MKKRTWIKQHKWAGIIVSLFFIVFCVSGVLLNHRYAIRHADVSRRWLPSRYEYKDWNGGLLRGSIGVGNGAVLVYGGGGVFLTDRRGTSFRDFNHGLPGGADMRQVRNVVSTEDGSLFAVTPFGLYEFSSKYIHNVGKAGRWEPVAVPVADGEMLTDAATHGDTLVVASRNYLYIATSPYRHFRRIQLPGARDGGNNGVSLFRTVWLLHSGALFGMAGKMVADCVAVAIVVLCVTGLVFWRRRRSVVPLRLHNRVGRYTIVLTLLIALSGWLLRPPGLILLSKVETPAVPGSVLSTANPWSDKLRMVRYDGTAHEWIVSTTEGFYSFHCASGSAVSGFGKVGGAPHVSVMGLTVMRQDNRGRWLCGSMSGLTVWDRRHGTVTDAFTGRRPVAGRSPVGSHAVAGYCADFVRPVIVDYYKGASFAPQPEWMDDLPMSLWNVALEFHSGRIYAGAFGSFLFIFLAGIVAVWCLWSGWKVRIKGKRPKKSL